VLIFLNGEFVPEERAVVSVFDRGFLYGDGVFEGVRIFHGKPFRWAQHIERFFNGARHLKIRLPYSPDEIQRFAAQLIKKNKMPDALLRLTLSRGVGLRGYSPKGADSPTFVMTLHLIGAPGTVSARTTAPRKRAETVLGVPPLWNLVAASNRLPTHESLASFKTANKLPQILARAEADAAGADEALLLNTDGHVVEATSGNLFWIESDTVCTPPLASGVLPGVTRAVILEICRMLGFEARQTSIPLEDLMKAQGVFLSLTSWGIVEAISLNGRKLRRSHLVEKLRASYLEMIGEKNVKWR
jgi:branched-chain amino acid aminotransferase